MAEGSETKDERPPDFIKLQRIGLYFKIDSIRTTHDRANSIKENWSNQSFISDNIKILDAPNQLDFLLRVPIHAKSQVSGKILIPCRLELEAERLRTTIVLQANLIKPLFFSLIFGVLLAVLFFVIYKVLLASIAILFLAGAIFFGTLFYDISKKAKNILLRWQGG